MMIIQIIAVLLTLALSVGAPFVAYPLADLLKRVRQKFDDKINWDGPDAEKKERHEDRVTNGGVVLVSILIYVIVGFVYMWYVQTYTYAVNPWMYRLVQSLPVIGNARVGYYDTLPLVYWTVIYWFAYVFGYAKKERVK